MQAAGMLFNWSLEARLYQEAPFSDRCDQEHIVGAMEQTQAAIDGLVAAMPEDRWSDGVYENGWNAKQVFATLWRGAA